MCLLTKGPIFLSWSDEWKFVVHHCLSESCLEHLIVTWWTPNSCAYLFSGSGSILSFSESCPKRAQWQVNTIFVVTARWMRLPVFIFLLKNFTTYALSPALSKKLFPFFRPTSRLFQSDKKKKFVVVSADISHNPWKMLVFGLQMHKKEFQSFLPEDYPEQFSILSCVCNFFPCFVSLDFRPEKNEFLSFETTW